MWSTIAREAPIGRFDEATFASYFLVMLVVRQLSSAWAVWELNQRIRSGKLSIDLLRPLHPLLRLATENLSAVPIRIMVLIPIVVLAIVFIPGIAISDRPLDLALALWATVASWLLTFLFQSMIGLLALYTQQSLAFQEAWFGIWAICSGYLIPLELVPWLRRISAWMPFYSMGGLPTEIALGHLVGSELWLGVGAQLAWVVVTWIALHLMWRRAMIRFEAYGS
jgi:ABC-2 type transport system permease protein